MTLLWKSKLMVKIDILNHKWDNYDKNAKSWGTKSLWELEIDKIVFEIKIMSKIDTNKV